MSEKHLYVEKICNGTVIDHIGSGLAFHIMQMLGLEGRDGKLITIGINVKSNSSVNGKKDIIKVENIYLDHEQINQIALIAPDCKVSFIEDYKVKQKFVVEVPAVIYGIIDCPNTRCISRQEREPVTPEFKVITKDPLKITCEYCGMILYRDGVLKIIRQKSRN